MNVKSLLLLSLAAFSCQAHAQTVPSAPLFKTPVPSANDIKIRGLGVQGLYGYQLEAQRQSLGDVLETIALAGDIKVMVDPALKNHHFLNLRMTSFSLEDLLIRVSQTDSKVEMWKSPSGTFFFSEKPATFVPQPLRDPVTPKLLPDPEADPFVLPRFRDKKQEPESHWGKIPFNGHDVYIIPLPVPNLNM